MFHTPPTRNKWNSDASITNSYQADPNLQENNFENTNNDSELTLHTPNYNYSNDGNSSSNDKEPATSNTTLIDITEEGTAEPDTTDKIANHLTKTDLIDGSDNNNNNNNNKNQINKSPAIPFESTLSINNHDLINNSHKNSLNIDEISNLEIEKEVIKSDNSSYIESFEIANESDFPFELLQEYELFLRELKEPKFERSLATFEIAELFQNFYKRFSLKSKEYSNNELADLDKPKDYQYYKYNLMLERLLCDKFYSQIMFPSKSVSLDEFEKNLNDDFGLKLGCLNSLNIHFKNLDIDLPESIEGEFVTKLNEIILIEFELFTAERSPTLKMKYLFKIHRLLGKIIQDLTNKDAKDCFLNTDIYLPILIFSIIKLQDLRTHCLVSQLNMIKRFTDEYIFDIDYESFQEEKGKLLYVCANFEACVSYLASVTLENLDIELPSEDFNLLPGISKDREYLISLLVSPISLELIDEETKIFKESNPIISSNESTNSLASNALAVGSSLLFLDYPSKLPFTDSIYHADQGLKSISNAVDSSIRNIMGKVTWLGSGLSDEELNKNENLAPDTTTDNANETLSDSLLQQLEENVAFQEKVKGKEPDNIKITPTSSISTDENNNNNNNGQTQLETQPQSQSESLSSFPLNINSSTDTTDNDKKINSDIIPEEETQVEDAQPRQSRTSSSISAQERLLSKFTTSMGGVMKNFRPVSASSSSTSLNTHIAEPNAGTNLEASNSSYMSITPVKSMSQNMRSRTTSFINSSLFGSPQSQSLLQSQTHAQSQSQPQLQSLPIQGHSASISSVQESPVYMVKEQRNSILSSLENALENVKNRSRGNSLSDAQAHLQMQQNNLARSISIDDHLSHIKLLDEMSKFKKFDRKFEELSMGEIMEMYQNYQYIMKKL